MENFESFWEKAKRYQMDEVVKYFNQYKELSPKSAWLEQRRIIELKGDVFARESALGELFKLPVYIEYVKSMTPDELLNIKS